MLVGVQIVQMESPTEAGPLIPIHGYTSLVGYHPCSPALQAVCEEGWAASQVLCHWPLAQVPQVSGLFLLALPGYHAVPVAWPERERDTSATLGVSVALKESW